VVVAPRDQRRPRGRAQRGGVEVGVAQAIRRDAVERRRRDHAAERGWRAEADIIREDKQDIGRAPLAEPPVPATPAWIAQR